MGDPDRNIDERRQEAEDIDTSRLLSLLSALSQSAKRAERDARPFPHLSPKKRDDSANESSLPTHNLITPPATEAPVRDLPTRGAVPDFKSALDDWSPRPLDLDLEDRCAATPPLGRRPRRLRWVIWMLASSIIAGGTAAAFAFGLADHPLSRRVAAALASVRFPGGPPASSPLAEHGELLVHDQKGVVGHLVPLGISVRGGSGGEIVILDGLVEGTQMSAGTGLSSSRWSLPATELDQAFVSAPKDFIGAMEVSAKLYSNRNDILQVALLRLEWQTISPETSNQPQSSIPAPRMSSSAPRIATLQTASSQAARQAPPPVRETSAAAAVPPTRTSTVTASVAGGEPTPAPKVPALSLASAGTPVLLPTKTNPAPAQAPKATARPRSRDEIDALLQAGELMLQQGDLAAARVALRRAADAGSAEAARDLGMSFDPSFLRRIGVAEAADRADADKWYAKARELGLTDMSSPVVERLATAPKGPTR